MEWPTSAEKLVAEQGRLASAQPARWTPPREAYAVGGCFYCSPRELRGAGAEGDRCWVGAALVSPRHGLVTACVTGVAGHRYVAGLLALREGPMLEAAVRSLPARPAVLLVNATGRDHPQRAGLALHLGAVLELPTVGVTHRPLLAEGAWPPLRRGASEPLVLDGERVGRWLCTRDGARPLAIHAAWRTDPGTAAAVTLAATSGRARAPEPIRQARRVARSARAGRL